MKPEEKDLLLKDLCARLPYNVLVHIYDIDVCDYDNYLCEDYLGNFRTNSIRIKPYLRPMSSMTKEEKEEYDFKRKHICDEYNRYCFDTVESIDWLNAHHFDYRGLIPMKLALEAPKGMYDSNSKVN